MKGGASEVDLTEFWAGREWEQRGEQNVHASSRAERGPDGQTKEAPAGAMLG